MRVPSGEGFQFLELGIGQAQIPGHGPIGRKLGFAANPGDGFAHIDGRQNALLEKSRT